MSDDLTRARAALIEAWRVHTEACGGEWIERDGLFTCFTGTPLAMYNPTIALADGFSAALAEREDEYRRRGVQFGFLAFESRLAEAEQAASRLGLGANEPHPSMALRPVPEFPEPAAVDVVEDEAALDEHVRVQADGFDESLDHLRAFSPPSVLKSAERLYLAWDGDTAAATSLLVATGREAGIFAVATRPEHRRRGRATAATIAAIRDAHRLGCDLVYLSATKMGLPVYERLGFRTVEHHRTFVRADEQPEH